MVLVIAAAFFMAVLFLLFRAFGERNVPLLPAIVVNYFVAFLCGSILEAPWNAGDLGPLWAPSAFLGVMFIVIFYLTGLSAQRAGVAATAVASKMSLVLTVLAAVLIYHDDPGVIGYTGIVLALVGVVLSSWVRNRSAARGSWILPTILFFGNAMIDITINWVQRVVLSPVLEAVFPTLVFAVAGCIGAVLAIRGKERNAFKEPAVWIGGSLLGAANYAALYFVVQALAYGGMDSSSVYPLINIVVILFGTALSVILFRERPRRIQYMGIACSVVALLLILNAHP